MGNGSSFNLRQSPASQRPGSQAQPAIMVGGVGTRPRRRSAAALCLVDNQCEDRRPCGPLWRLWLWPRSPPPAPRLDVTFHRALGYLSGSSCPRARPGGRCPSNSFTTRCRGAAAPLSRCGIRLDGSRWRYLPLAQGWRSRRWMRMPASPGTRCYRLEGRTEVVEHRQSGPVFCVVDDQRIRERVMHSGVDRSVTFRPGRRTTTSRR